MLKKYYFYKRIHLIFSRYGFAEILASFNSCPEVVDTFCFRINSCSQVSEDSDPGNSDVSESQLTACRDDVVFKLSIFRGIMIAYLRSLSQQHNAT